MKHLYTHLKQPASREFPNDIWVGRMVDCTKAPTARNTAKVKESEHLISVCGWTPSEVRCSQLSRV